MATAKNREGERMDADREELVDRISRAQPQDGGIDPQPGLHLHRWSLPSDRIFTSLEPAFCVIAQGRKLVQIGQEQFRYDPAHYLINTIDLPMIGQVVAATVERPYLSCRLTLDPAVVASVLMESHVLKSQELANRGNVKAVNVSALDARLLDAILRLVRLIETPDEYSALAPLVIREIVFRLLMGAQGARLRHLATSGGQAHRMVRAVETLRKNFDKPLKIENVARGLGMSVSGFHAHFKAVTALSPLQFQKQLRLQEARRLMLSEKMDAAEAGFHVGYEDAAHFNREYKRHFGAPPMRDIERLRELVTASA